MKLRPYGLGAFFSLIVMIATAEARDQAGQEPEKPRQLQIGAGTRPFDVSRSLIDLNRIQMGGPPRDGIPALVDPKFVDAAEAREFMRRWDQVLGVVENGVAKAYPVKILTYHEVVNDRVGGRPVAVTY